MNYKNYYCSVCGSNWEEYGTQWKGNTGYYFRCKNCLSKRKPVHKKDIDSFGRLFESIKQTERDNLYIKKPSELFNEPEYITNIYKSGKEQQNILVVGDLHLPFVLDYYLDFCTDIYDKYNCNHVIFIGDLIDNHFSSFHATDPDGMSAKDELEFALTKLQEWSSVFPVADVCLGNHDELILRQMYKNGVSKKWIKDFKDVLGVNWDFKPSFVYNDVLYRHGINMKASPKSGSEMMNVVQGHFHTESYISYTVGRGKKVFGVQCPCGVNRETYAMAYAQEYPKQAIGCTVILENGRLPIIEMCDL